MRQAQKKEARPEILWKRTLAGFSEVGCPETVETFEIWNFSRLIHTMKDSWYSWLLTAQAFLVAVALCLQSLRQRFSWMRVTEPVLDRLSSGTRLFVMAAMAMVETLKLHFSHLLSSAQVMTFKTGSSLYRTRGPSWSYLLQVRNRPSIQFSIAIAWRSGLKLSKPHFSSSEERTKDLSSHISLDMRLEQCVQH